MSDQQLSAIERDMEQTRVRLASTIDQLVYRASPKTIARREIDTVKGFFVGPDGPRTDNIAKLAGGVVGFVLLAVVVRRLTR